MQWQHASLGDWRSLVRFQLSRPIFIRSLLNGRASGRLPEDGSSILSERTNGRETQRPSTCVTRREPWVRFPPRPPSRQKVCQLTAGVEKLTGSWGRARTSNLGL